MFSQRITRPLFLQAMIILLFGVAGCTQVALPNNESNVEEVAIVEPTAIPPTAVPPTAVPPTAVPPTAVPPTDVLPTVAPIVVPAAPANGDWSTFAEVVDFERHALGNPYAELTIIEFSDFM